MDVVLIRDFLQCIILWFCVSGITALLVSGVAVVVCSMPAICSSVIKKYGWFSVVVTVIFVVVVTEMGSLTHADKERSRLFRQLRVVQQMPGEQTRGGETFDYNTPSIRSLEESDYVAGFVLARIGTNEVFDFAAPADSEICSDWLAYGAASDWMKITFANGWEFPFGTNTIDALTIYSSGMARPVVTNAMSCISPFKADLGIVPALNWDRLGTLNQPSQFWQSFTSSNTFVMTWQNVLLNREPSCPVSFQSELFPDGSFVYRYDLSRLSDDVVTNLDVGGSNGGNGRMFSTLSKNTTSLYWARLEPARAVDRDPDGDGLSTEDEIFIYGTNPYQQDTDLDGLTDREEIERTCTDPLNSRSLSNVYCDGVAIRLGEVDPYSFPEGSTNTVWEHLFYTGTTNTPFAYPQSSRDYAVLKVAVSGVGSGELIVGDRVVPLLARSSEDAFVVDSVEDSTNVDRARSLFVSVARGSNVRLFLRGDDTLSVELDSDDFAFGVLPSWSSTFGYVNFPNVEAEPPCVHDLQTFQKRLFLTVSNDASLLTCVWQGEGDDVTIQNIPPRAAQITARPPLNGIRDITYFLDHPCYLFGRKIYSQSVRFCPRVEEYNNDADSEEQVPPWDEAHSNGVLVENEFRWCCFWGRCSYLGANCICGCDECICVDVSDESDFSVCPEHHVPYEECALLHNAHYAASVSSHPEASGILKIRVPLDYDWIGLSCPEDYRRCCPCPSHGTNYVGLAYKSRKLDVVDQYGRNFSQAYESTRVRVAGVNPSVLPGDAKLAFVTNGVVSRTYGFTTLGVGFATNSGGGGPRIETFNDLSRTLGVPMTVTTNLEHALCLELQTNVGLPFGNMHFSLDLEDAEGQFSVWMFDHLGCEYRRLLDSDGKTVMNLPLDRWRILLGRGSYADSPVTHIYITSSRPGKMSLRIGYWGVNGGELYQDWCTQSITSVMPPLLPDYDRNGRITISDALDWDLGRMAYFWLNNDIWRGDDAFEGMPEGFHWNPPAFPTNGTDRVVNGRNDLVNLFPFAVNLQKFFEKWGADVTYEFLTGTPRREAGFTFVRSRWNAVGDLVKNDPPTVLGEYLHAAELQEAFFDEYGEETGYELPREFLQWGEFGAGVVAVEFRSGGLRLPRIRIRHARTGEVLFENMVDITILDVHSMYRWVNLMATCDGDSPDWLASRSTVAWPDHEHADANVVFVHGYNMNPVEAWDWSQAMFKRLWWAGLDAGFTAVLWRGNETQRWMRSLDTFVTRNYHQNVLNAFRTSESFTEEMSRIPGAKKYYIAHSLGNMLVSAAREDRNLSYERYFMLNAAVPCEAYDPLGGVTDLSRYCMTPAVWRDYSVWLWASHWYELFQSDDARHGLTWKNRFKNVDKTVNFYSSEDEVVANGDGSKKTFFSRSYAWYNQELAKGSHFVDLLPEAGWAFGHDAYEQINQGVFLGQPMYGSVLKTPEQAQNIPPQSLIGNPFFLDFRRREIYGSEGSSFLQENDMVRWRILSHGIPAESFAAGANPIPSWSQTEESYDGVPSPETGGDLPRNINMATDCREGSSQQDPWIHSYFIQKSLVETWKLYEFIVKGIKSRE